MLARTILLPAMMTALFTLAACGSGKSAGGTGGDGGSGGGAGGAGGGSSAGCAELCAELNKCPGVTPSDCAAECPDVEKFNTDSACKTQYADEVACILGDSDPCGAAASLCAGASGEYIACSMDYCDTHANDPGCL
jgi:hypothetical protein